jgi:hypothetical protein
VPKPLVPPNFSWYRLEHEIVHDPEKEADVFYPVPHADRWDPWMVTAVFAVLAVAAGLTFVL